MLHPGPVQRVRLLGGGGLEEADEDGLGLPRAEGGGGGPAERETGRAHLERAVLARKKSSTFLNMQQTGSVPLEHDRFGDPHPRREGQPTAAGQTCARKYKCQVGTLLTLKKTCNF